MRIAVLIIGLLLGVGMFLQSLVAAGLGGVADNDDIAGAGSIGVFMALFWLAGSALVMAFPLVSVILFAIAGAVLIPVGSTSEFRDLIFWGVVSLILAVMSFFGWRGKKRDRREAEAERLRQAERDTRMEALLRQQSTGSGVAATTGAAWPQPSAPGTIATLCSNCKSRLDPGAKFCMECGAPVASVGATT